MGEIPASIINLPLADYSEEEIEKLRIRAFLGTEQCYGQRTSSGKLSKTQTQELQRLNIHSDGTKRYHKGLVCTAPAKNPISVLKTAKHVERTVKHWISPQNKDLDHIELIDAIDLYKRVIMLPQKTAADEISIATEGQMLFAQLGCLSLPIGFLAQVAEPVTFILNTAPAIGRYVYSIVKNTGQ